MSNLELAIDEALPFGIISFSYCGDVPEQIECTITAYDENGHEHPFSAKGRTCLESLNATLALLMAAN